jgi:esterase/lipase superfamily enzyme
LKKYIWLAALAALGGCASAPCTMQPAREPLKPAYGGELGAALNTLLAEPYDDTRAIEVVYATNRAPGKDAAGCSDQTYGVDFSSAVSYGVCRVNVPKRHKVGGFEPAPDPRADPHKYFRVLGHARFQPEELPARLDPAGSGLLVFVHGFNVKFDEAVLRAAQIAYDLKFQGKVVLYTWPAGPKDGMFGGTLINKTYEFNKGNAARSVPLAADFFRAVADAGGEAHVLVHSMGHQVVVPALGSVSQEKGRRFLGELLLNAPDIDLNAFTASAPALRNAARRVTVYCSYNDNAIAASEVFNKGRRLGGCELVNGVDVINVGEIDAPALGVGGLGHGYYAGRPILTDIFETLLGIDAGRRLFVRKSEINSTGNYYLRP